MTTHRSARRNLPATRAQVIAALSVAERCEMTCAKRAIETAKIIGMTTPDWLDAATILRGEVGSGVHGIAKAGRDDRDEMGVCVEPFDAAWTTQAPFEQHIYRTAVEREGKQNAPSQPGDLDLTVFSLRKWIRLALSGNPTVLLLLFVPTAQTLVETDEGHELRALAPSFASRKAIERFRGYLSAQRHGLDDKRNAQNPQRQATIERFGFDTKFAGHMLRLGYQGVEYAQTGRLTLPMPEPSRQRVRDVRDGLVALDEVKEETSALEQRLLELRTSSPLPEEPETAQVNEWMRKVYLKRWV